MKKTIVRFAALGVLLVACGGSGAVVATVNGQEVTASQVEALYSDDLGAVPADLFAENLLNTIVELLVVQVADSEFGISVTEDEIEERRAEIETQIASQSGDVSYEEFLEQNGFTDERIARIAHQQLVADQVEERLLAEEGAITDQELQDQYDSQLFQFTEACVSHILVPTEEEAVGAKERIDGGEAFADVAMELGTDGTAPEGGELGCTALSGYVPEFAVAASEVPLNEVSEPVRSQFGFHLILVTERTTQAFEDVQADLRAALEVERGGTLVQDWLLEAASAADVTVVEEYGTWVTDPFPSVQPPA
ncbi:MAG: peptidylprolyl isomerase [Acidimicrobiia bacterium]